MPALLTTIIGEFGVKFKFIFILFSATLLLFLAVLVFLPLIIFDSTFSGLFWRINWPFILVLALVFVFFNIFYFANRQLFTLLEKEDWPALVRYLEDRVIQKGNYSPRLVRLLANTYLVLSDSAAVMSLENKTAVAKPSLVDANVLVFGVARILGNDISGAIRFFEVRRDIKKTALSEWVHWYHGLALLLDHRFEEAADEFTLLARESKDGVISGLSSYFLCEILANVLPQKKAEFALVSEAGREKVLRAFPGPEKWNREITRLSTEIHAAAISRYLEETGCWLYRSG